MSQDNELSNINKDLGHTETSPNKPSNEKWSDLHGQTYKKALDKAWARLVEDMAFDELLDRFKEKELFSPVAIRNIREERNTSARNRAVLEKVSISGPEKYEVFKECLTLVKQEHLVKFLQKYETEIAAQDEVEASVTPEMVSERAAIDEVEASVTTEMVSARAAIDEVEASVTPEMVSERAAIDEVEASVTLEIVSESAAIDEVEASVTPEIESKLPAEILRKGSRAIQIYKKALSDGKHAVQNIRVMLVGHSGVGKTTLLKRLLGQDVDIKKIESTEGIEVHVHRCKIDVESGQWHCQDKAPPHPNAALLSAILPLLTVTPQEPILQPVQDISPEFDTSPITEDEDIHGRQQNVTGGDMTIASEPESDKSENTSEADVQASIVHGTYLSQDHAALDHLTQYDATLNVGKGCEVRPESSSSKNDDTRVKQQFKELMETYESSKRLSDSNFANVSFWDFAGQYIFYNTHQVFLSHRTIYLLVTKLKHILDEAGLQRQDCDTKLHGTIEFWLDSIHFFCGKENHDPGVPPVILVATHCDKIDQAHKERLIHNHFQNIRDIFANKITAEHIVDDLEFAVDNSVKDPELEELKKAILDVAKTQYYWQEEYPVRWLTLEKELFVRGNSGEKVLRLKAVKDINRMLPFPLEETELELFLQFQSDLGNILYISEWELKDYVLLNPQWVADAFKCIITAEHFLIRKRKLRELWKQAKETGKISTDIIEAVWSDKKSEGFFEEREFLLLLMQQLNLIARPIGTEQPHSHYFVPCLITKSPSCKPFPFKGDATSVLTLSAASRFFPMILFYKLIASCIQEYPIHKDHIYNCSALFEHHLHVFTVLYVDNTVKVWVNNLDNAIPESMVCRRVLKFLIECMNKLQLSCIKTPSVSVFACCPDVDMNSVQGMHQLPDDIEQWQELSEKKFVCSNERCASHTVSMRDALKYWIPGSNNAAGVFRDPNILARCPTQQEIVRMSTKIGVEFSLLGIILGLSQVDLQHIALENHNKAICQMNAMLNLWMTRQGSKATIGSLKKAMEDVGIDTETVLAQSLETSCADADK